MCPPVLSEGRFGVIRRKGPLLTERNSFQATTWNPQSNQIVLDGLGPSVAQGKVVLFRSALIAMTFDNDTDPLILSKHSSIGLKGFSGFSR